jgi:hypothetical protein
VPNAVVIFQREFDNVVGVGEVFDGRRARVRASIEGAEAMRAVAADL